MVHKDWCGKPCGECNNPCALDQSIPYSPDCEGLNEDGTHNTRICSDIKCDAYATSEGECPVCRHTELKYDHSELLDESYIYEWKCESCGATGKEFHALTFVCHIVD